MERRLNKILAIAIISVVYLMSIGYSVLNKNLNISGDLTYRSKGDIRITNLSQKSLSNATIQYADYSKNEINFAYNAEAVSASVSYEIEVTNYTNTPMGILKIGNLPENATIDGYKLKEALKNTDGALEAGDSTTFTITFKASKIGIEPILLTFDFEPVYKVTYDGFSNTDNFKTEVIKGDNFSQDIGNSTQICKVTMNGSAISNYTFINGIIGISNVTGDILINGFTSVMEEPTTPNPPELNGEMIPVYYDNGWKKADVSNTDNSWYDYTNQKWANAVTVVSSKRATYKNAIVGTSISMDDINTMWVWVPRYSYTIKSEDGSNYYGKKSSCTMPTKNVPGEIDVKFISKETAIEKGNAQYTGNKAENWRTNEAFDFSETDAEGNNTPTKRAGIWVGKFEPTGSYSATCKDETCDVSGVTILPNQASIRSKTVSNFFYMARSMQVSYADTYGFAKDKGDLHMMKNDEWGAVAYLSQSRYGKQGNNDYSEANKEVYINNNSSYITGTSGGGPSVSSSGAHYKYDDMTDLGLGKGQAGPGASTTGNITGIYDMSGGAYEYVMGVLEYDSQTESEHPGEIATGSSGFKGLNSSGRSTGTVDLPNEKYYNTYKSANPTSYTWSQAKPESACDGGVCYGHALSETGTTSGDYGWYQDYARFVNRSGPWFRRGGGYGSTTTAGVFYAYDANGDSAGRNSCRLVLV